ncbi:HD domain-containing protein [Candidatus Bathyarchaeota archaeon]|nr:MAG: HD domain-containing protein [Candidatus Bathyarchaeota archaeon]RJS81515.1 MAG: HD domain-containing protein [Candidatus Bathyarchaeota archaeon]
MHRNYWGEIKDPVHGYVYITELEKKIIDSFPVQRLRRLRQLAGAEYVYPGANHTRFEHSVGVMYLAGKVVENPNIGQRINKDEAEMVRIAALLHDVGHGPFSHVFEHLLDKELGGKTHEDMTRWIIATSELKDILNKAGYDPEEIGKLATNKLEKPSKAFLGQIISSAVDVDKLDFVVRDTHHTGAEYGFVDVFRLIHAFDVLNGDLAVDLGALSALESFIIARIESFKSIYFHRVGRAAQIMLAMAMEKANEELGLTSFKTPEEYLAMDDYTVWTMLKNCEKSREIIESLERRKMLKCAYERTFYQKDAVISNIFSKEAHRKELREDIAKKAGVDTEAVIIDVPTVPSVPYHHSVLMEPMEIPTFYKTREGNKIPQRLSEISKIFEVLKGFINILRVYTDEENREKVGEAALNILGGIPTSAKISY